MRTSGCRSDHASPSTEPRYFARRSRQRGSRRARGSGLRRRKRLWRQECRAAGGSTTLSRLWMRSSRSPRFPSPSRFSGHSCGRRSAGASSRTRAASAGAPRRRHVRRRRHLRGFRRRRSAALAIGAVERSGELGGVLVGIALLFAAGLLDDLRHLPTYQARRCRSALPVIALASGLQVEIVGNDVLAWAIGDPLAGRDHERLQPARQHGRARGHARHDRVRVLRNRRAHRAPERDRPRALPRRSGWPVWASFHSTCGPDAPRRSSWATRAARCSASRWPRSALASSWTVAGTTVATVLLPLLILAIPILDTTLVTLVRLAQRRPVSQGGRDHTSHRLVYYGLSEANAVLLLALVAAAIGATASRTTCSKRASPPSASSSPSCCSCSSRSFLSDLEERSRRGDATSDVSLWRALVFEPRRLVEVVVDFVVICATFLAAYLLVIGGLGSEFERSSSSPRFRSCWRPGTCSSSPSASTDACGASRPRATSCR